MDKITHEPVMTAAGLASLVSVIVIFLRAMGWLSLTTEQYDALMGLVAVAAPLIMAALYARPRVTPTADPRIRIGKTLVPLVPRQPDPEP